MKPTLPAQLSRGVLVFLASSLLLAADDTGGNVPPASGSLCDLSGTVDLTPLKVEDTTTLEMTKNADGSPAIKAVFNNSPSGLALSFLKFPVPAGGWNLTGYTAIHVNVTNSNSTENFVRLRVDNPGNPATNFNADGVKIPPGETKTLAVVFGKNFGNPAKVNFDPSNVIGIMLYVDKPATETTLVISNLIAVK